MNNLDPSLAELLRSLLGRPAESIELTPDLDLREFGMDSLMIVELVDNIETTFALTFPDDLLVSETFMTPGSIWEVITSLRSAR